MSRSPIWALVLLGLVGSELGWARSTLTLSASDNEKCAGELSGPG
jgi:hypothetical protein